ncbi:LamB/YcsF family protein [Algoriphagus sp. D3-2-R+10]|uniref:LamB/YcsF family protein n=1 Tax=Algoriphagus aurantiacus TaxID=3103948 RepID=UPI002B3F58BE|nr:LamB/YcsF family protein [Algoriphagus sp. D3-2-R+10]MEB2774110.1 LamB/YcsF family protein [Algoriphagus sp. D3-2-R+10]
MKKLPEINCDLGEGMPNEIQIFPHIDTASIACGGHFGDENSISESLDLALKYKKKAGAHPSYPDQKNFGRKTMKISDKDLKKSILIQILKFELLAEKSGLPMDHIKFHGALYNDAVANAELADILTDFIASHFHNTPIFAPPHSELEKFILQKGLKNRIEVFGDRRYLDNYQLVPRSVFGSHMISESEISPHLKTLLENGYLLSDSGKKLQIKADTICFHGDNLGICHFLPIIRNRFWT